MQAVTQGIRQGIRWTLLVVPKDVVYADDIGLLSDKHQVAHQKADRLS